MPGTRISISAARQCWLANQGLDRIGERQTVQSIIQSGGWMNSAGGGGPYVAFHARLPRVRRSEVDEAIRQQHDLIEVMTVRSATMLVPRRDHGLALQAGRRAFLQRVAKLRERCDVTDRELEKIVRHIVLALAEAPATSEELRGRIPTASVRDLGPEGKKLGEPTTFSLALKRSQLDGLVERIPLDNRLDGNRFAYQAVARPLPSRTDLPEPELDRALAELFVRWAGPATAEEVAFWVGIGIRKVRAVLEAATITPVSIAETGDRCFVAPEALDRAGESANGVVFLPFRDNYLSFRRGLSMLTDLDPDSVEVLDWMNRPTTLAKSDSLHHSAILVDGRLAGIWEFDGEAQRVVSRLFEQRGQKRVREAAAEMQSFIATDLGDFRYYAFDTPKTRGPRLDFVRAHHSG